MKLTREEIFLIRLNKSGLLLPFNNAVNCAASHMGIQSQYQQFSEISLFNRVNNLTSLSLKALFDKHDIIKLWGPRMTVHLVAKNDWQHIARVYGAAAKFIHRVFQNDTKSVNKALAAIEKASKAKPRLTKEELSAILDKTAPGLVHDYRDYAFIVKSSLDATLCAVPAMPHTKEYVHRSWVIPEADYAKWQKAKLEHSLEHLINIYFKNYGPASFKDFMHWSGLTKTMALPPFKKVEPSLEAFDFNGTTVYLFKDDKTLKNLNRDADPVKLLGKFDPLFVCYSDKTWAMPKEMFKYVWRPAAHVESVLIAGQKAAGTWRYALKGNVINFDILLFGKLPAKYKPLISEEAQKLAVFMGKKTGAVSYKQI